MHAVAGDARRRSRSPARRRPRISSACITPEFLAGIRELCERGRGRDRPGHGRERAELRRRGASPRARPRRRSTPCWPATSGRRSACGRPPGHHAEAARAMGFCLVNHAAVAAAHARAAGVERVAVLDWDAHHGNGTQAIFWDGPRRALRLAPPVPVLSGDGEPRRAGRRRGRGARPSTSRSRPGSSERGFMDAFEHEALPALRDVRPGPPDRLGGLRRPPRRPAVQPRPVVAGVRGADPRGAPASAPARC